MHSKKIIACLLLLLFIEKAGLRLWIHTHYHTAAARNTLATPNDNQVTYRSVSEIGCDCVDDFFIPLSFTDVITAGLLSSQYFQVYYSQYKNSIAYHNRYSVQLRGPPAC